MPGQPPTRRDPLPTAPVWERITLHPPGLGFEPGPPRACVYDIPDTECEGWSTDAMTLRAASVRGESHRWPKRAKPRQDCVRATVHEPTGIVVFAVADGVSGALNSELGSREACRAAVEALIAQISQGGGTIDFDAVVRHAVDRLRELTQWSRGLRPEQAPEAGDVAGLFATTLVAGVVFPTPQAPTAELCRVGDSGAWVLDHAREHYDARLYTPLFSGKTTSDRTFVSHQVAALPAIPERLEVVQCRLAPTHTLLVGTDGFGDPLGDGDGETGALFAEHLRTPPPALWLAHVLDFSRDTFDDDRTLLALWPRPEGRGRR